jgi:hypothetical protein
MLTETQTTLSPSVDPYFSKSDEAEAKQWNDLTGLGEAIYDDNDYAGDLAELGLAGSDD